MPRAGVLRNFIVHGAFEHKRDAVKKEREGKGRWILRRDIDGHLRYVVLSERK